MRYSIEDAFNNDEEFETEIKFLMEKYRLRLPGYSYPGRPPLWRRRPLY